MKLINYLFLLCLCLTPGALVASKVNPALKCLAHEEEKYHKEKANHARAKLNQDLIIELSQSGNFILKPEYLALICSPTTPSAAEKILELQMLYGTQIFHLNSNDLTSASLIEYKKQLPQVFVKHLANLQSELQVANCLENQIPEIKKINEKLKYLEEELSIDTLAPFQKEIAHIFKKIARFDEIKKKCKNPKKANEAQKSN